MPRSLTLHEFTTLTYGCQAPDGMSAEEWFHAFKAGHGRAAAAVVAGFLTCFGSVDYQGDSRASKYLRPLWPFLPPPTQRQLFHLISETARDGTTELAVKAHAILKGWLLIESGALGIHHMLSEQRTVQALEGNS